MTDTTIIDVATCSEPGLARPYGRGPQPAWFSASLRAMFLSDGMGAYDLLEHQMELWANSIAERGASSRLALSSLETRLEKARDLEIKHGAGCLLRLSDPFLSTLRERGYLVIPEPHLRAARVFEQSYPHLLRDWVESAPTACAEVGKKDR